MENVKEIFQKFLDEVQNRIFESEAPHHYYFDDELHLRIDMLGLDEMEEFNRICRKLGLSYILAMDRGDANPHFVKAIIYDIR